MNEDNFDEPEYDRRDDRRDERRDDRDRGERRFRGGRGRGYHDGGDYQRRGGQGGRRERHEFEAEDDDDEVYEKPKYHQN